MICKKTGGAMRRQSGLRFGEGLFLRLVGDNRPELFPALAVKPFVRWAACFSTFSPVKSSPHCFST
jgi:hypothetical protein